MSLPTLVIRFGVYERDQHRCVSCGRDFRLTFQHRQATGMGGSKIRPTFVQGLTACDSCNSDYEHRLQQAALRFGWKVRRWVEHPGLVPVFYAPERRWYRLTLLGTREHISHAEAMRMMAEMYGPDYDPEQGLAA